MRASGELEVPYINAQYIYLYIYLSVYLYVYIPAQYIYLYIYLYIYITTQRGQLTRARLRFVKIIKPLRLLRLLRMLKLLNHKAFKAMKDSMAIEPDTIRLANVGIMEFISCHFAGCLYWLVKCLSSTPAEVNDFLQAQISQRRILEEGAYRPSLVNPLNRICLQTKRPES